MRNSVKLAGVADLLAHAPFTLPPPASSPICLELRQRHAPHEIALELGSWSWSCDIIPYHKDVDPRILRPLLTVRPGCPKAVPVPCHSCPSLTSIARYGDHHLVVSGVDQAGEMPQCCHFIRHEECCTRPNGTPAQRLLPLDFEWIKLSLQGCRQALWAQRFI